METIVFTPLELILLSALGVLWLIQLIYYFALYNRIHKRKIAVEKDKVRFTDKLLPLSVIIYTRDDYKKLSELLPLILEQNYPEFEVIVVNDNLKDGSEELLSLMQKQYSHLHYTFIPDSARYISRRKLALTLGVKASKYEWLVFTEANCFPVGENWLRLIARNFTPGTQVVLGYSNFLYKKGWAHSYRTFDLLFMSLRYLGCALANRPYMGIGRNLAYRKEMFFRQRGFSSHHLSLNRGDDDIFINQIVTKSNTRVETDMGAKIRIQPLYFDRDWKEEKMTYALTSKYYRGSQRMLLGFETLSRLLFHFYFTGIMVFFLLSHYWYAAGVAALLYLIRFGVQAFMINKTSLELGDKRQYYLTLPIFDILLPLQSLIFEIYRLYHGKSYFMKK